MESEIYRIILKLCLVYCLEAEILKQELKESHSQITALMRLEFEGGNQEMS